MSASKSQEKRKKKKYYMMSSKKQKGLVLGPGLKGFLVTCNNESQCVKESYNLLNEFADELYGSEVECDNAERAHKDTDIDEEFAREIESLKTKKRRFQQIRTAVKGILFINATIPDPTDLATSIFENVLQTKQRKTRFICKMQPIVITCKASQNDIRKHLDEYLEKFIENPQNAELKYKVIATIRHNSNVSDSHIVWYTREAIEKTAPKWTGALIDPELVISVYVIKSICCIGFLKNFVLFKKYNLSELATSLENSSKVEESAGTGESITLSIKENDCKSEESQSEINSSQELENEVSET